MAVAWRRVLWEKLPRPAGPFAMVMLNDPESVALFFALSCFPVPLILLPLDAKPWASSPPLPGGTHMVLSPSLAHLDAETRQLGVTVTALPESDASAGAPDDPPFMAMPGVVLFTSGSTGLPRPVYRSTTSLLDVTKVVATTLRLERGGGVIAAAPVARALGLHHGLLTAMVLEAPLALLGRFDHKAVLDLFVVPEFRYWAGTSMMADVLSRCPMPIGPPAPPVCVVSGRVTAEVARRFKARFGMPVRQVYGTTETGAISVDGAFDAGVRSETAGRPLPGVDVRIGDDPREPSPPGTLGRIWHSSPYTTDGYGFPPDLETPGRVDRWWATPDVGEIDEAGRLLVSGRLDDCFRTDTGHMVNPGAVAAALEAYPGIADVAVVTLTAQSRPVIGVLVETAEPLNTTTLRKHLWQSLPRWSQPRVVETTSALPRLPNGRADRRACIALLERSLEPDAAI